MKFMASFYRHLGAAQPLTITIVKGVLCTNGLGSDSVIIAKANIAGREIRLNWLGLVLFICLKCGDENRYNIQ